MLVEFLRIFLWEAVQNLPPMGGFGVAMNLWRRNRRWLAVLCALGCAAAGSLLIALTEPLIRHERPGPILTPGLLVNTLTFGVFAVLGILYMDRQSKKRWDFAVGSGMALVLAVMQATTEPTPPLSVAAHALGLAVAFSLVLLSIRWVVASARMWAVIGRATVVTAVASAVIVVFDYGHRILG